MNKEEKQTYKQTLLNTKMNSLTKNDDNYNLEERDSIHKKGKFKFKRYK